MDLSIKCIETDDPLWEVYGEAFSKTGIPHLLMKKQLNEVL